MRLNYEVIKGKVKTDSAYQQRDGVEWGGVKLVGWGKAGNWTFYLCTKS